MQTSAQKDERSRRSRINGAKSRGPKTPQGKERSKTVSRTHGLYATEPSLRPTIGEPEYAALRLHYQSAWSFTNQYLIDKVDDLVAYRWELNRLREVRRQVIARAFNDVAATYTEKPEDTSIVAETEIRANAASGTLDRFDLRIRRCNLELSRIERDIIRDAHFFSTAGASHNLLKPQDTEPRTTQPEPGSAIAWAEETFDLALDVHQAGILTANAPETILNAARYSGKTTALALRALYESTQHPTREIACLSPNNALIDKVKELAAIGGLNPTNITGELANTAGLIIIDDAAEIKGNPKLNPQAQLIIAGTPKGAAGYFHEKWQSAKTTKIFAPAKCCDTIDEALLLHAAAKLTADAYKQEMECEFLEIPQPRCRLLPFTQ
jgi:hypothetical protein